MNKTSIKMVRQEKRNYLEKSCFVIKKKIFRIFLKAKKKEREMNLSYGLEPNNLFSFYCFRHVSIIIIKRSSFFFHQKNGLLQKKIKRFCKPSKTHCHVLLVSLSEISNRRK
jgi:hypothetical protein